MSNLLLEPSLVKEKEETGVIVRVEIVNANGVVGAAGILEEKLRKLEGFKIDSLKTAPQVEEGASLSFRPGFEEAARRVEEILTQDYPLFEKKILTGEGEYDLVVVLGL
jgi:hypothetical protein